MTAFPRHTQFDTTILLHAKLALYSVYAVQKLAQQLVPINATPHHSKQIIRSMVVLRHRIAGLAVVDRLKTEVITAAITHYQHIALLQARRHIIKRVINRHRMKHPEAPQVDFVLLVDAAAATFSSSTTWMPMDPDYTLFVAGKWPTPNKHVTAHF